MLISANILLLLAQIAKESPKIRYGQPIKVNWAYTSTQREDTSGLELKDVYIYILLYSVFVLYLFFQVSCRYIDMNLWFLNSNDKQWC